MARLKGVFLEVMQLVNTETSIEYLRVWNDQLNQMESQQIYSFPNLACFVEIDLQKSSLSSGIVGGDILMRFHIVHVEYDAGNGHLEENLTVFQYRDELIDKLMYRELLGCSGLQLVGERPDYSHSDVYHYILEFNCSYIDDAGDVNKYKITKEPPTLLEVDATLVKSL